MDQECGQVLVVEDNYFSSMILTEMLKTIDCVVTEVGSGESVMETLETNPGIKLVMMDMNLPGKNGYELTRELKQKYPGIRVVAQTGSIEDSDKQKALDAGCDDYISKPINLGTLREIVYRFTG